MIDEIPIIGVTEWTCSEGVSQKWVTGHRLDGVQASRWGREEWGTRARQPNSFNFELVRYFKLEPVG